LFGQILTGKKWLNAKTPIKNLYLIGVDLGSLGIMGVTIGDVTATGLLNSPLGFYKIMGKCDQESAQMAAS
jgi:hypothetical protein